MVYNQIMTNLENFPYMAVQAIQAAIERRGVAHLDIPVDIADQFVPHANKWQLRLPDMRSMPEVDGLDCRAYVRNDDMR